jgi:hypothetical protein
MPSTYQHNQLMLVAQYCTYQHIHLYHVSTLYNLLSPDGSPSQFSSASHPPSIDYQHVQLYHMSKVQFL